MTRWVALLRGINVGGKNLIGMPALKACFEALGFADVVTYIQSGNVNAGDIEQSTDLVGIALPIERALCDLDESCGRRLKDSDALSLLDLLLDHFAFGEAIHTLVERADSRARWVLPILIQGARRS